MNKLKITGTLTTDEAIKEYEEYSKQQRKLRKIRSRKVKVKQR